MKKKVNKKGMWEHMYLITFSLNLFKVKFRLFQAANPTYGMQKFRGDWFSGFLYRMLLFLAAFFFS